MEQRLQEIGQTILKSAQVDGIPVVAIILYGSRGRDDYSFDSNCDIFTLLSDRTTMLQFVLFPSEFRMASYELGSVKMYSCRQKDLRMSERLGSPKWIESCKKRLQGSDEESI